MFNPITDNRLGMVFSPPLAGEGLTAGRKTWEPALKSSVCVQMAAVGQKFRHYWKQKVSKAGVVSHNCPALDGGKHRPQSCCSACPAACVHGLLRSSALQHQGQDLGANRRQKQQTVQRLPGTPGCRVETSPPHRYNGARLFLPLGKAKAVQSRATVTKPKTNCD